MSQHLFARRVVRTGLRQIAPFSAIVIGLAVLAALGGCSASARLESTYGTKYRYAYSLSYPVKRDSLYFRDERLIIQFQFDDAAVGLQIQNISPFDLQVRWANVSIGIGGVYSAVRNLSNFYDTTSTIISSPLIPPLGVTRDVVTPAHHVFFDGNQWREVDLLPTTDFHSPALRDSIINRTGSVVDIVLPMEFGREEKMYRFTFTVDSVVSIPWSMDRLPAWFPRQPGRPRLNPTTDDQITAAILVTGFLGFSAYLLTAKKNPPTE